MQSGKDIDKAIESWKNGYPILLYDSSNRESEIDMVYHASKVTPESIYKLRNEAGGLICFATSWNIAKELGLIWGDELIAKIPNLKPLTEKLLFYKDRPAFTIWVNHVNVRTGISDNDRALTIRELYKTIKLFVEDKRNEAIKKFVEEFQAPGHVPLLAARNLKERKGHTELSIYLSLLAKMEPATTFAEMLDFGVSLSLEKAEKYAKKMGYVLISGKEVLEACEGEKMCWDY
ncbi:3,4-dihydroxy-2-butanone 4-phosphate synthase [Caldisphaera lagunensis DSM 15908]|uniref:3,4-dihydroxy-2-butanone 4-phosphate synthase n=1 Tax=Caldisphaera lagunensis (strain DSM 15908 / JCM 11604 / ANMR 0165 / IC-154) TaxID=1056495 RepID=L0ACI5_CALLD|nr:3,4-dihydroxy-2-butanone-4-phosphate synthase [Caldisphaera lagunensis]AFZ70857.1 3,4-dihydroxy-2-butanone 4-phosphate synthase [Caldisphaera lagunensis DSM 15908]